MKKLSIILSIFISIISVTAIAKNYNRPLPGKAMNLSKIKYRIVYESYQNGNWDIFRINADGSGKKNLTRSSEVNELYPKVSPDGDKICYVTDKGEGRNRKRDVYIMNINGSNRKLISKNSRQPAWSPDGKTIAFVKAESSRRFSKESWATKGLYFYKMETEEIIAHMNKKLEHLYNIAWSPKGKYITATVLGGMGYRHTNIAIDLKSNKYFRLGITGCRPEFNPKGNKIAWGRYDTEFRIAKINLKRRPPVNYKNKKRFIRIKKGYEVYHIDWSPNGKYAVFSYGPNADQVVGGMAPGWNICVAEISTGKWTMITKDGNHNKEPDWVPSKD